ncbi:hypothetical protein K438DRAFT_1982931 [Mycena galopus ATCC 62051]|nr:hypothetical protein K438DRAFT_1982931 [Mycena galopus ATCC 62051]
MAELHAHAGLQHGEPLCLTDVVFLQPRFLVLVYESTWCPTRVDSSKRLSTNALKPGFAASGLTLLARGPNPLPFERTLPFYLNRRHSSIHMPAHAHPQSILPFFSLSSPSSKFLRLSSTSRSSPSRHFTRHLQIGTMPCVPPYHPSRGHESMVEHDNNSSCMYYAVWHGRVRGVYSNSWLARAQTDGWTDASQKGFKRWSELLVWWSAQCRDHHQGGCPPFEPVVFSLDPPSNTHPSSAPCSHVVPAPAAALMSPAAAAPAIVVGAAVPPTYAVAGPSSRVPLPAAGSPFTQSTSVRDDRSSSVASSFSSTSSLASSTGSSTDSLWASLASVKKEEPHTPTLTFGVPPRVTLDTRVQLSPTGCARAAVLLNRGAETQAAEASPDAMSSVTPRHPAAPIPSVQLTPKPALAGAAPAPNATAAKPIPAKYGIRGVPIFYPSHEAAEEAARLLGLISPRIMVSVPGQPEKLEAWILGKPFVGEDVAAAAPNAA